MKITNNKFDLVQRIPQRRDSISIFFWEMAFHLKRILGHGLLGISRRLIVRVLRLIFGTALLPFSTLMHLAGYRQLDTHLARIGHLALEPDLILKAQALGLVKSHKWILRAPRGFVANSHLLGYWRDSFLVVESGIGCFLLDCLTVWGLNKIRTDYLINSYNKSQAAYDIYSKWGTREPLVRINDTDKRWFEENRNKLGLPKDCWFVCVHAREGGFSPVDENVQSYRNGSISKLTPAIYEIVRRGGWVVRLGDPTSEKLPPMEKVIDYAHSALRSERMDVLLIANSRFILGNTSGVALVGSIFGIPCALANMVPMSTLGIRSADISIPKLHIEKKTGRIIPFKEVMDSPVSNFRHSFLYQREGIELQENSAEDILLLVRHMLDSLGIESNEPATISKYGNEFLSMFRDGHFSFGSCAQVCEEFFVKYRFLL